MGKRRRAAPGIAPISLDTEDGWAALDLLMHARARRVTAGSIEGQAVRRAIEGLSVANEGRATRARRRKGSDATAAAAKKERERKTRKYLEALAELMQRKPHISLTTARTQLAFQFRVSLGTVKAYTPQPKRKNTD